MIYIFMANGMEEIEALQTADILRRAELEVQLAAVGGTGPDKLLVTGAHGIKIVCDITEEEADPAVTQMIVLPGGIPGALNLGKSQVVQGFADLAAANGIWIGAICAAPVILGQKGLLEGRRATCFPGYQDQLVGAVHTGSPLEVDGKIITARSMGCAIPFGLRLVEALCGRPRAELLRDSLFCPPGLEAF